MQLTVLWRQAVSRICAIVFVSCSTIGVQAADAGAEVVISDDGRQIQINADGSWVQLSKDRFATNEGGERVRLRPDGTWTIVTQDREFSSAATARAALDGQTSRNVGNGLYLREVAVLRREIKRQKAMHAEFRTVFTLQVINESNQLLSLNRDIVSGFRATTSKGGNFPIIGLTFSATQVPPGGRASIVITSAGAPKWYGNKYLSIEVAQHLLGNDERRILSKNMGDVKRQNVNRFAPLSGD